MGLFLRGQLAYCSKRNMSREKPRQVDDQLGRAKGGGNPPEPDEPPARAAAYLPPMEVPKESRYHTIDMKAVRLSPDIDPQRMKTQLSLRAVRTVNEKRAPTSRVPAWIALLLVGGALGTCVWWFSRWRDVQGQPAPVAAGLPVVTVAVPVQAPLASPLEESPRAAEPTNESGPSGTLAPLTVAPGSGASAKPTETVPPANTPPKPARVTRQQVKRAASPVISEPRKVSTPPTQSGEVTPPASSQPKLWLE